MTYKQAYDKIIEAYFKDEIQPMDAKFCFCGTLAPDHYWRGLACGMSSGKYPYSLDEYAKMERALLSKIPYIHHKGMGYAEIIDGTDGDNLHKKPAYEEFLFAGMSAALDVLKQIHIERGEVVDELPSLTKRALCQ